VLKKIIQVKPNRDFTIHVYFDDGHIKLFDMKPLLNKGVFKQISDIGSFLEKCTVMNDTLAWDLSGHFDPANCIDIDPETIYSTGVSVNDPLAQASA
jgi:hypothetical protein